MSATRDATAAARTVIGSGSFGTACATALAQNCERVTLWGRDPETVRAINETHENPRYLPGLKLPPNVGASNDFDEALSGANLVVTAAPSHARGTRR